MTAKAFGGKKAAAFVAGGGRSKSHPTTAKGTPRKAAAMKRTGKKK